MRAQTLALLASPWLASAGPIPPSSAAPIQVSSAPDHSSTPAYDYICQGDDESFIISIQANRVPGHRDPAATCGDSVLSLQQHSLDEQWQTSRSLELIGASDESIVANSIVDGQSHTIGLSVASTCSQEPAVTSQVTTVVVTHIDGTPSALRDSFTIHLDQTTGDILAITPSSTDDLERFSSVQAQRELDHYDLAHDVTPAVEDPAVPAVVIEAPQSPFERLDWQKCTIISDAIDRALTKAKGSLRVVLANLPFKSTSTSMQSNCATKQNFLGSYMGSAPSCGVDKELDVSVSSATSESDEADDVDEYPEKDHSTEPSQGQPAKTPDYILLPIIVLASAFCCTGLAYAVSRRCCSPRAKADWRARCEESRNRRQYRRLQRRHAMRQWFNRLWGMSDGDRTSDYDEKRRLILSQEHVLEDAMLAEIYRLRLDAGMTVEEIRQEECHVARSVNGSLPPYTVRALDAPPSYRTSPSDTSSAPRSRSDSGSVGGSSNPRSEPASLDSSIAALSPRHSSETLRSDASLV